MRGQSTVNATGSEDEIISGSIRPLPESTPGSKVPRRPAYLRRADVTLRRASSRTVSCTLALLRNQARKSPDTVSSSSSSRSRSLTVRLPKCFPGSDMGIDPPSVRGSGANRRHRMICLPDHSREAQIGNNFMGSIGRSCKLLHCQYRAILRLVRVSFRHRWVFTGFRAAETVSQESGGRPGFFRVSSPLQCRRVYVPKSDAARSLCHGRLPVEP